MATGGRMRQRTATKDPGADLRAGYMASLRASMGKRGRAAITALSIAQAGMAAPDREADDNIRRDPVAELRANRHTSQQFANPGASAPNLRLSTESLRDEGDEEDQIAADTIDASVDDVSEEASQADDLSLLSRAKSQLKTQQNNVTQKAIEKGKKELEKIMQNLKTEGSAKFASAADEGEGFEVVDTIGTAVSVAHATVSIFDEGMNDQTKSALEKLGFPMLKWSNALDLGILAGTNMQVLKWSAVVIVIIPFCAVFILMAAGAACDQSFICSTFGPGALLKFFSI